MRQATIVHPGMMDALDAFWNRDITIYGSAAAAAPETPPVEDPYGSVGTPQSSDPYGEPFQSRSVFVVQRDGADFPMEKVKARIGVITHRQQGETETTFDEAFGLKGAFREVTPHMVLKDEMTGLVYDILKVRTDSEDIMTVVQVNLLA